MYDYSMGPFKYYTMHWAGVGVWPSITDENEVCTVKENIVVYNLITLVLITLVLSKSSYI